MSHSFEPAPKKIHLAGIDPGDTDGIHKEGEALKKLEEWKEELYNLHYLMYADNRRGLLVILQGIDASGKDGAVRYLASALNPQGTNIYSFKKPSDLEIDHDYLWRIHSACPGRGEVSIFNRSHYEEVTVLKVHPNLLDNEFLPPEIRNSPDIWKQRYRQIRDFERMLVENGTVVLKFFLHISRNEQEKRFEERMRDPRKHWKFSAQDLAERQYWDDYMRVFEEMIEETSTDVAPWYIVPADRKWFRNYKIAGVVVDTLSGLKMEYPKLKV